MWIRVLGAVEVLGAGGEPVGVGGPRVRALLALLALDAGRIVGAERLIDGLYGEEPPGEAGNALQSQVSRLRRGLGAGELVEFHPAGYRLVASADDVDALVFERLAREGQRALAAEEHGRAAGLLREALGLWRGPALADVDAPFAAAQVARLEELRVVAVEDRAEAELALGRHRDVVSGLQEVVAAYPLRERPRGLLMRALYGSGRQAEALAVYEEARRTLAEELGADPSPELAEVHLAILRAEPSPSAAVRATLPAQLTSFVGRDEELGRVGKLLKAGRLVTLLGPGGAGKTRLAIEVASGEPAACFVELAPVRDDAAGDPVRDGAAGDPVRDGAAAEVGRPLAGGEVPRAVAAALGLRDGGLLPTGGGVQPDPVDRLVAALTDRPMLLVLDNCEHVIEDAARLAHRLLGACPGLRILATSREPLGITGEAVYPVPQLGTPPPGTPLPDAMASPAVRLFGDRASAVSPGFEIGTDNVDTVLRICAALDGLPLAIELAAARLRSLPLATVEARLRDRFRLLSRGSRTAAPRHQTLRAVVEWSWGLLNEEERELAQRLSVFAGEIDPAAAARVCDVPDAEDLLADLADKSLLQKSHRASDEAAAGGSGGELAGFRMLETIREFCAERLAEAGEEEHVRRAHAAYFLDLATTADPYLRRAEQLDWLARLSAARGDLHAALRWATQADPPLALRLLASLSLYWYLRGLRGEGAALAVPLLERLDGPTAPEDLDEEYVLCVLSAMSGGFPVEPHLAPAKAIMVTPRSSYRWPFVNVLWAVTMGPDPELLNSPAARRLLGPDPWLTALSHFGWGWQRLFLGGDLADAEREFQVAQEGFEAVGDRWGMANTLDSLSMIAARRGDRERSMALLDGAFDLAVQLGALDDMAELLCRRGDALLDTRDLAAARAAYDDARAAYEQAAELARRAGTPATLAAAYCGLAEVARLRGEPAEARRAYEMALDKCVAGSFGGDEIRIRVLIGRSRLAAAEGDVVRARTTGLRALTGSLERQINIIPLVSTAIEAMAEIPLLNGDGEQAALLLGAAAALRGTPAGPDAARVSADARALAGEAAYTAAHDRGAGLSGADVLALFNPEQH